MHRAPWFVLVLVLGLASGCTGGDSAGSNPSPASPAGYQVHASQAAIPFANGFAAASYDLGAHAVSLFRDHIYAKVDETHPSMNFCTDLYFGWRRDGSSQWLTSTLEASEGYVPGTGIVKVVQRPVAAGLSIESYFFAPMTVAGTDQAVVALVHATNTGAAAQDCALFAQMNFHLGGEAAGVADATGEWAFASASGEAASPYLMEGKTVGSSGGNRIVFKAIGAAPLHQSFAAAGAGSPFALVQAGSHMTDPASGLNADGIDCGLEWQIGQGGALAAGADAWAGLVVCLTENGSAGEADAKAAAAAFAPGLAPQDVLAREVAYWQSFHAVETPPAGLRQDEAALLRQSTAVMKMAQCREPAPSGGQILASLPPGQWNMCWARDASYAIAALCRAGHFAEAKAALQFFLGAQANGFGGTAGLARPYAISLCRYLGSGVEESDDDGNGFNVELDDLGLFLFAFAEYVERSGDTAFLAANYPTLRDGVAGVLVSAMEANGLILADSSIWERHINTAANSPDGKKHFAYTSINAANGLARAAALASTEGDAANATAWAAAAHTIADALLAHVTLPSGALAQSEESIALGVASSADAAVVEAVNFDLDASYGGFTGRSNTAVATMALLEGNLRAWPLRSPGFLRNEDAQRYTQGNWYDLQEWIVCDLRVAAALVRMGRASEARALLDWVDAQAAANMNLIPELYDAVSSGYQGAVPMVGFGAGAWILGTFDYYTQPPT